MYVDTEHVYFHPFRKAKEVNQSVDQRFSVLNRKLDETRLFMISLSIDYWTNSQILLQSLSKHEFPTKRNGPKIVGAWLVFVFSGLQWSLSQIVTVRHALCLLVWFSLHPIEHSFFVLTDYFLLPLLTHAHIWLSVHFTSLPVVDFCLAVNPPF